MRRQSCPIWDLEIKGDHHWGPLKTGTQTWETKRSDPFDWFQGGSAALGELQLIDTNLGASKEGTFMIASANRIP